VSALVAAQALLVGSLAVFLREEGRPEAVQAYEEEYLGTTPPTRLDGTAA